MPNTNPASEVTNLVPGSVGAKSLLIRNARCVATFDHADPLQSRELRKSGLSERVIPRAMTTSAGLVVEVSTTR